MLMCFDDRLSFLVRELRLMSLLIHDETVSKPLIEQRRARGLDRYDEVWDGVYVMSPIADNQHQGLVSQLTGALLTAVDWAGLGRTFAGANVSDRRNDWTKNYRVPDVLVFLNETRAEDCGSHWLGGPDFAIEIVSRGDHTLDKLDFYAAVQTRELLVIDRDPWQLTLYRLSAAGKLEPVQISSESKSAQITSDVVPVFFSLDFDNSCIRVSDRDGRSIRDIPMAGMGASVRER